MESEIDWLEDQVLEKPTPATPGTFVDIEHTIMSLSVSSPRKER
jgi:hypothetical protein